MRFFTPLALLPFAALAASVTFNGVRDTACQRWDGSYAPVSTAQLEKYILEGYPSAKLQGDSDRQWSGIQKSKICPPNSDNQYAWIRIPEWTEGAPEKVAQQSGSLAVIYYKETDTYNVCTYLASIQHNIPYAGFCKAV
ncbi:hypothetical protein CFE70_006040 [Pyrenophora teres f. teres 0-1]|uniref:Uncharacterized protein n=2 Tax=Pyrenophora teres f. teres TaxID=97479 RepID=E3RFX5_PYRTT|nr:hypothetical protein PTT_06656 [Pyrenophora teres f. teres 0-1]KAE8838475.1 hypothetical protein HRS9139_02858 [Pyrenophora teres f. teres]CAA9962609.1 hypothetical protein PTMSG1_05983 [Pyrenophora teres f. maculata]KAE8844440.1 hypothetical protein PTNB85_02705 [Pyrenophora teres f. teres]KAE8847363.1 hypothetical protein HRS9122_04270 [Pyrenophora teres f. teres]